MKHCICTCNWCSIEVNTRSRSSISNRKIFHKTFVKISAIEDVCPAHNWRQFIACGVSCVERKKRIWKTKLPISKNHLMKTRLEDFFSKKKKKIYILFFNFHLFLIQDVIYYSHAQLRSYNFRKGFTPFHDWIPKRNFKFYFYRKLFKETHWDADVLKIKLSSIFAVFSLKLLPYIPRKSNHRTWDNVK